MDRPMRGAVIGCGFFAQNHLNAWRDLKPEGVEIAAVCDIDPAKAQAAAAAFGVPGIYTDPMRLLAEERLDFVDVATRMKTHRDLVLAAVGRGIRTVVQKPFAPDWASCVAMVRAAAEAGVPLAVHENFRHQRPMLEVRRALDSGIIGAPSWLRISFRSGYDVYRTQPSFHRETRFAILDTGVHVLDLARFFMGEAERLSCETQRRNTKNAGEDTATMLLRHTSGAVSVVETTYEARQVPDVFPQTLITIKGERGSIELQEGYRLAVTADGIVNERDLDAPPLPWAEAPWHVLQESVLLTQRAIPDAWRAGRDADTSGADNLRTYALAEAAYRAAESGRVEAPPTG